MKSLKNIFALALLLVVTTSFSQINSEKITPPSEGKTVIYFLRTTGLGSLMNFRYFDSDKYLGRFNGINYLRYECDPGEKTFWIKAENIDVLKANLEAGKIYLVETNAVMGAFSAGAKFRLIDLNKKSQVKRINKLFEKKDAKVFTEIELKEQLEKMKKSYQKSMKTVGKKIRKGKFKTLEADMNYK